MLNKLKKIIALDNPLRLLYHKIRAIIANYAYGFPHKDMIIIGVTGTNGKTTTSNIIASGLHEAGKKVCMFSTVNYMINGEIFTNNTKMTSPDAFTLQSFLKQAKEAGCTHAVIETASHGIAMNRIWGLQYDICVLTNISQDHLDLHKTMQNYVETKLKIFQNLIIYKRKPGIKKTAIINIDTDYKDLFLNETYDSLFTYGVDSSANLQPKNIQHTIDGTEFKLQLAGKDINAKTIMRGDFNVYNITAAIGVFVALGMKQDVIEEVIKNISGVPGRLEEVQNEEGYKIFIDYAHTADALEQVLHTLKNVQKSGKLIIVFGATGDRDKTKRPIMGRVVAKYSDKIILTQDDDYSEKTNNIIKDVLPGIERKEGENFWIIPDRKEAIRTALVGGQKDDIIVIAGKGDEHIMVTNNGQIPWHDKTIAEEILHEISENKLVK